MFESDDSSPCYIKDSKNGGTILTNMEWKKKSFDMEEQKRRTMEIVSKRDPQGRTMLHYVAYKGELPKAQQLFALGFPVDATDKKLNTPLHVASENGQASILSYLLQQGANVNRQNGEGKTSLHLAVENGQKQVAQILLASGASPNVQDLQGATALHHAATQESQEMLKLLIQCGAFVNARDFSKETALFYAIRESNTATVDLLVNKYGADLSLTNEDQESPLQFAREMFENDIILILQGKTVRQETNNTINNSSFIPQKSQPMMFPNIQKEQPLQMVPNYRPQSL